MVHSSKRLAPAGFPALLILVVVAEYRNGHPEQPPAAGQTPAPPVQQEHRLRIRWLKQRASWWLAGQGLTSGTMASLPR